MSKGSTPKNCSPLFSALVFVVSILGTKKKIGSWYWLGNGRLTYDIGNHNSWYIMSNHGKDKAAAAHRCTELRKRIYDWKLCNAWHWHAAQHRAWPCMLLITRFSGLQAATFFSHAWNPELYTPTRLISGFFWANGLWGRTSISNCTEKVIQRSC